VPVTGVPVTDVPVTDVPATGPPPIVAGPPYDGPSVRPVTATLLFDGPGLQYDVSPDGAWIASFVGGQLCLTPVDPSGNEVCVPTRPGTVDAVYWSPDSTKVVIAPDVFRTQTAGPIVVLGTDGSATVVVEAPAAEATPIAAPFAAAFVDGSTIVLARILNDPLRSEFTTVDLDGEPTGPAIEFEPPAGTNVWIPFADWVVGDVTIYMTMADDTSRPVGIWGFDLATGVGEPVAAEPVGAGPLAGGRQAVDLAGGRLLVADTNVLGNFRTSRTERDLFSIVDLQTGEADAIRDRDPRSRASRSGALARRCVRRRHGAVRRRRCGRA